MRALAIIPTTGLPPARARLVNLTRRISDAESQLARLVRGRDQLRAELSRADSAKAELETLITEDASSLASKLRSGVNWALSSFGSVRAQNLIATLAESQVQHGIGQKALNAIEAEIAVSEREVSDLKAHKPDMVRSVLIEAADGFRADLLSAVDDMRQAMTTLAALDRLTARSDGSFSPTDRIAVELPSLGTMPAQAVIGPEACIERAQSIWSAYADELDSNPLANVENLTFPHVIGNEDDGRLTYDRLTHTERNRVDQERSQGVK
jgi:cell division protein FtsB